MRQRRGKKSTHKLALIDSDEEFLTVNLVTFQIQRAHVYEWACTTSNGSPWVDSSLWIWDRDCGRDGCWDRLQLGGISCRRDQLRTALALFLLLMTTTVGGYFWKTRINCIFLKGGTLSQFWDELQVRSLDRYLFETANWCHLTISTVIRLNYVGTSQIVFF